MSARGILSTILFGLVAWGLLLATILLAKGLGS